MKIRDTVILGGLVMGLGGAMMWARIDGGGWVFIAGFVIAGC